MVRTFIRESLTTVLVSGVYSLDTETGRDYLKKLVFIAKRLAMVCTYEYTLCSVKSQSALHCSINVIS